MPIRNSAPEARIWVPVADFLSAADEWHRRCRHVCLTYDRCSDRYLAMIEPLTTWMAEQPRHARLYWGSEPGRFAPELLAFAAAARQHLTTIILQSSTVATGSDSSRVHIEFLIGIVRHVVCRELRKNGVDYARLEQKLTGLALLI